MAVTLDQILASTRRDLPELNRRRSVLEREAAGKLLKLLDQLDEHDDVQNVWANFDIPDEVMAKLTSAA